MDVTFMILATLVAVEHIYIMCLETIFTKSETTARTFNMEVEELSRPSVSTLFKNQGVYNLLLAVLILIAVWVMNDLFWTRCFLSYVALVAIYGGITSSPTIILKQGAPALVALIYSFVLLQVFVVLAKIETSLVFDFAFKGLFLVLSLCSAIFAFMASWAVVEVCLALFWLICIKALVDF